MMEYLMDWVTQLILFLFLVLIVDMLLPHTAMRKYVHTVISLLFLLIMLHPIFQLFEIDIQQAISESIDRFDQTLNENQLENQIESKKKEIQASQDAYVVEELIVQMKSQVKKELAEKYGVEISDLQIQLNTKREGDITLDMIDGITVYLQGTTPDDDRLIQEVTIGEPSRDDISIATNNLKDIRDFLAEKWGIDTQQLEVIKKGEE